MSNEGTDMHCPGCRGGDKVPAKGYFLCPICDAEWHEEEEEDQQPDDLVERLRETLVLAEEKTPDIWLYETCEGCLDNFVSSALEQKGPHHG